MSLPEFLGRLRRVRRIGVGGFASVWLYHDVELDSPVAVKALADNWAQQLDVRERFLNEARILRRADSAYVVQVHDLGETADGTPYFVMSYADRGTVADLLSEGSTDLATTVRLIEQAAHGLADLHAVGVIHRDIKPQNLLLRTTQHGGTRLQVADLGVAKAMLYASGMTQVVGTPAYMAPEQADRIAPVDGRADVHALGAVAYQLLCGRQIREHSVSGVADARLPAPPGAYVSLPPGIDDVILRALQPDPAIRWEEPRSFANALVRAAGETQPRPPQSAASSPPTTKIETGDGVPAKRRWWPTAVIAAVTVAIIAAGAVWFWPEDGSGGDSTSASTTDDRRTDDSDGGDGRDEGGDEQLAAQNEKYCRTLIANSDAMAELDANSDDPSKAGPGIRALHRIRSAAPPELEAEWATIDDPYQDLDAALKRRGATYAEFGANPKDYPRAAAAASRLGDAIGDFDQEAVERLTERACGQGIGEILSSGS